MRAVASFLVVFLMAGCTELLPDRSRETLVLEVEAVQPFVLGLPVPVAVAGTMVDDWLACVAVPPGWTVRHEATERGAVLEVAGLGSGRLTTCSNRDGRGGIAEDYLDASWTTNHTESITAANPRAQTVHIHSDSDDVRVVLSYEADSRHCGRTARFAGLLSVGWTEVHGHDQAACS